MLKNEEKRIKTRFLFVYLPFVILHVRMFFRRIFKSSNLLKVPQRANNFLPNVNIFRDSKTYLFRNIQNIGTDFLKLRDSGEFGLQIFVKSHHCTHVTDPEI